MKMREYNKTKGDTRSRKWEGSEELSQEAMAGDASVSRQGGRRGQGSRPGVYERDFCKSMTWIQRTEHLIGNWQNHGTS